jgi:NADP-reducing hydrogenase subunit HndA
MLPAQHYHQPSAGAVLAALHEISARCGYLPQDELRQSAQTLGVPFSQMVSAASFYAAFSFRPCGRNKLQVCEGTACYVKGAAALLQHLSAVLGIAPEQSTQDLLFMLKRVRCVGSCGLAPVVRLGDETLGRVTIADLDALLARHRE